MRVEMRVGILLATLRASLTKHVNEVGTTNLFLLLALAVITFYPLLFVGFTTNDDLMLAIEYGNGDFWWSARKFSVEQGRVGLLWAYPLFQLPYFFDNQIWYLATKYGSFLLLLGALYFALFQLFRSRWIALASLVFFLAFVQNGWDHNALTSYPFGVNFLIALFLVSLGLFSAAIERKNVALAGLSAGFYFLALVNEFFLLYFPFYVAVLLSRATPGESIKRRLASGKKYLLPVALALLVYLTIYVVWRSIHPSTYAGNRPDGWFNPVAAAKVIATYSLSAFPHASLRFLFFPDAQLPFVNSAGAILSELSAASLIKAGVAGLLLTRLMFSPHFVAPRARMLLFGAALAFVAIFLPNVLLGFTSKYQGWVASGSTSYLYTYHSFIAAVAFAALILAYMKAKIRSWRPKLKMAVVLAGVIAAMSVSFAVEVRNQYIALDQKLSHRKWQLMDVVIKSPAFVEIPDNSTVVAPTLAAHQRGIAFAPNYYWSKYIKYKTGKSVRFADDKCISGAPCYSLVFRQEQHSDNQLIVLSKIKHPDLLDSSELTIYSMPNQRSTMLLGSFTLGQGSPRLAINDVPVANVSGKGGIGLFSSNLPYVSDAGLVQTAKVTGNVDIIPEGITVLQPRLRPWSAELAEGIDLRKQGYPDFLVGVSGMSGYEPWGRWTDAAAGPVATFRFRQALPRQFALELTAGAFGPNAGEPVKVRVGGAEKTFVITAKSEPDTYRLVFETDGTADSLEIVPPKPTSPNEIDPKNGDTRKLGVSLFSIKIHELVPQN